METDINTSAQDQEDGKSGDEGERITCSIAVKAFGCHVCAMPLGPPIFKCPFGHFFCSSCRGNLPEDKCKLCSTGSTLSRSIGMESAVQAILVSCRHAAHGCIEKTTYFDKDTHEMACPHAPCLCPEPGCGFFAGTAAELLAHLSGGEHEWPSTRFRYWTAFDVRVDEPGTHVLLGLQPFLLSVQPAAPPPGRAVSLVCVPPFLKPTGFRCAVSFSCFRRHRGTSTVDDLRPLRLSDWPPAECICVLPNVVSDGGKDDAGVVLTITIVCADPDDEDDDDPSDMSYIESDEDDSDSSS
ncbi:unnamed protein product [Urochloa decumbens]|uniref:RING-type E3 ubiquitin transferase n=1 Tax=Urochloa decumbens TaxID=240449 RepID=A0ABC8Z021_9POAL